MRTGNLIAHIFSIVLQPLLMPLYSILLLFAYTRFFDIYHGSTLIFLIPVFLFSFLVPAIFLVLLKKLRMIKDYAVTNQKERTLPYLMTCFSCGMMFYYFSAGNVYIWFLGLIAIPFVVGITGFIINLFWKISVHMLGIGSLIGSVMSICFNVKALNPFILFIILFILAGCLGVSQLYLRRNTAAQIYVGFIVGLVLSFLCVWFSIYYMFYLK